MNAFIVTTKNERFGTTLGMFDNDSKTIIMANLIHAGENLSVYFVETNLVLAALRNIQGVLEVNRIPNNLEISLMI